MKLGNFTHWSSIPAIVLWIWAGGAVPVSAQDWPQWGGTPSRNMYSTVKGLPDHFSKGKSGEIKFKTGTEEVDRSSTENLKWSVKIGSQSYGNVTVAGGRVFIGTN